MMLIVELSEGESDGRVSFDGNSAAVSGIVVTCLRVSAGLGIEEAEDFSPVLSSSGVACVTTRLLTGISPLLNFRKSSFTAR